MNSTHTIAFYNLENLFDPEEGPHTRDPSFTPGGSYRWDRSKYNRKIDNLGRVISQIGPEGCSEPPSVLGVCEVENETCLKDLVSSEALIPFNYGFIHFESPDRRGLDTALLYRKDQFTVLKSRAFDRFVPGRSGSEPTRDILHVEGKILDQTMHVLVNHWPSRLEGSRSTREKRRVMARHLSKLVDTIYESDSNALIIVVGDFNDQPWDYSLRKDFDHDFHNPFGQNKDQFGTTRYKNKWVTFDQILLNSNLMSSLRLGYAGAGIYSPSYLIENKGRHKGSPRRSFRGKHFQNGFSDHFPVYALFSSDQ